MSPTPLSSRAGEAISSAAPLRLLHCVRNDINGEIYPYPAGEMVVRVCEEFPGYAEYFHRVIELPIGDAPEIDNHTDCRGRSLYLPWADTEVRPYM